MRAPAPLALGCISLVLCLLELPGCRPLPAGRSPKHREPPDWRPSPASLQVPRQRPSPSPLPGDPPGLQPLAPPQPAGGPRHRQLIPRPAPRHGLKLIPRHRPRLAPRHGPKLIPRHRPRPAPRHRPQPAPRHGPKLIPRHRLRPAPRHGPKLIPRYGPQPTPRHGPKLIPRHRPQPAPRHSPKLMPRHGPRLAPRLAPRYPGRSRGRRHTAGRLHHAQLLRVGCMLGTCQVQNLSHRLWQLMGQSGRQDSSPMNPNSPHSYG